MGAGARLERALISFMLDLHTTKHGYTEVLPPFMVNSKSLFGTGQLPKFAEDLFRCSDADAEAVARGEFKDNDHWLIPTAEVPVTNLYRDEILDEARLPISPHGLHALLPRRGRSGGQGHARHHPPAPVSKGRAGQVHAPRRLRRRARDASPATPKRFSKPSACPIAASCSAPATPASPPPRPTTSRSGSPASSFTAKSLPAPTSRPFRRAAPTSASGPTGPKGKTEFVHTINGSGLAVGRTWLAILENYQQADGSVVIPEPLRPYMGGLERITR